MNIIVVGDPNDGAVAACRLLPPGGTLVWDDTDALRAATDDLASHDWDALMVPADDEPFATGSMSHRAQLHGQAESVVLHLNRPEGSAHAVAVAVMVLRHLPPVPVVVTGSAAGALATDWESPRIDLELDSPLVASHEDLVAVLAQVDTPAQVDVER